MAFYLLQATYTPEAWANLTRQPQDREQAIRPVVERLGGKVQGFWWSFGEYDAVVIVQMPDNVSAAAFSIAASASGGLKAAKTTPLISIEEGVGAMRMAAEAAYRPPGG
jgi:uncharacterized protein with GYD domain